MVKSEGCSESWMGSRRSRGALEWFEGKDLYMGSPDERVLGVLSQVCLCSPNLSPERGGLGL
jgi:hypothetical protein